MANGGGVGPIVNHIYLDGKEIARVVTDHQQRRAKRTSAQTRGRYGGQNLAFN
jgi:hypothetical protein